MKRAWLVPWFGAGVALLFLAMGPGKEWEARNAARGLLDEAQRARVVAEARQKEASEANLAALQARAAARREPSAEILQQAAAATTAEERAYHGAKQAWTELATQLDAARDSSAALDSQAAEALRLERNIAWIGAGNLSGAATDLEDMLRSAEQADAQPLADQVREQLSRAYFHAAYLMRKTGSSDEAWRLLSERARQNARVLAEADASVARPVALLDAYQRNLEVIIDFERRSLEEAEGVAQPKDCAGGCTRPKLDSWPWGSRGKKPGGQPPGDQRGGGQRNGENEGVGGW